ncbi:hypothetical protein REPUB_Repub02eG0194600 [Reevesia pubescens]
MQETLKTKKPRSKPSVKASSAKRPSESDQEFNEVKMPKKKFGNEGFGSTIVVVEEVMKTREDAKKQLFQQLFTEDDEIVVLKNMLDYLAKKGVDPFADMNAFHDFVNKSIHTDVSKAQLMYKIRRLRKKNGLDMIEGEKKEALEKWRKLKVAELELFLQRNELVKEQVKLMLDFYKSGDTKMLCLLGLENGFRLISD